MEGPTDRFCRCNRIKAVKGILRRVDQPTAHELQKVCCESCDFFKLKITVVFDDMLSKISVMERGFVELNVTTACLILVRVKTFFVLAK